MRYTDFLKESITDLTPLQSISPRQVAKLEAMRPQIDAALAAKQIVNPVFKEFKDIVSRLCDAVQDSLNEEFFNCGAYRQLPEELRFLDFGMGAQGVRTWAKKIAKADPHVEHPLSKKVMERYNQLKPLLDLVDQLKAVVVKTTDLRAAATATKQAYQQKLVSHEGVQAVLKDLEAKTEQVRAQLVAQITKQYATVLDQWEAAGKPDVYKYTKNAWVRMVLAHDREWAIKSAKQDADQIVDQYTHKSTSKIAFIINKKGDLKKFDVSVPSASQGRLEGTLNCEFHSGARFKMYNIVVFKMNSYGTQYFQNPARFTDVYLSDGTKMATPSIEKMETQFE